ncbi:hypothetical protein O181_038694 [Austropuccinia psidii MF-1]|uniref:Uncharacterized protein n=1 Tax=Austropuccinia psidii MF-1 TaxID=1389203 RepID=A0A9Q3D8V2_9BASI|nr:hypothetical protein [Austropuccinia psidii MF-1]
MLTCPHCPLTVTPPLPSSLLTLPHPRRLQSLRSCSALKIYLLCRPQPSLSLLPPAAYHAYAPIVPSQDASDATPPPLLTLLMLLWHPQDMPPRPPSTLFMPSPTRQLPFLRSRSVLPTCL